MLQVIAGHDPGDPASVNSPVPDFTAKLGQFPAGLRIGAPRAFFFDEVNPEVSSTVEKAIQVLRDLHAEIRDDVKLEVSTDRTLSSAESYAFHQPMVLRSPELYQPATLARIKSGENRSGVEIERARRDLEASRGGIRKIFEDVDILMTPTVPIPPPKIEDLQKHPENLRPAELLMLRNTRPFNVWGIPAISVPCGFTSSGLPIGLQLAAAPWREDLLLQVAYACEQPTEMRRRK
jgi:Asp-tRNA(Asn)/Glu-tRNA(Gln) amidotransferase A subunit family amidase